MSNYRDYWQLIHEEGRTFEFLVGFVGCFTLVLAFMIVWLEAIWADLAMGEFIKISLTAAPFVAPHALLFRASVRNGQGDNLKEPDYGNGL